MPITIKFNQRDADRIAGKLRRLKENCSTKKGGAIANIVMEYVSEYQYSVVEAMGSVYGDDGGDPGLSIAGKSASVYWTPLAEYTMGYKREKGLSLYVWSATGKTQKAVKVVPRHVPYRSLEVFAGIDRAKNPDEYRKAMNTEFGGVEVSVTEANKMAATDWASRPLFTIANQIFLANKPDIILAIRKVLLDGVNWGGGR